MKEIEITQMSVRVENGLVWLTSYDQMNDTDAGPVIPIAQWRFIRNLVDSMIKEGDE